MLKDTNEIHNAMVRLGFPPNLLPLAISMVGSAFSVADVIAALELEAESGFEVDFEDILLGDEFFTTFDSEL